MNMEQKGCDDGKQIIKFPNSGLLIQNEKPLKIYLEGFPISEFVELMRIVKDHGGEVSSRVGAGVIILSHPNCSSETQSSRFDVKWLYDCVKSSRILNPSKYQIYSSCQSFEENKSSKGQRYTDEEDRAMIQYLYDNDAIEIAGGTLIWHQMRKDGMMQHHSERSLAVHFSQCLKYRVQDLISDEEVLRQFQLRTVRLKRLAKKRRESD